MVKKTISIILSFSIIVGLLTLLPTDVTASLDVPCDAVEFNGHYYYLTTASMLYNQALEFCESVGGHIVTISNKQENDFVYETFCRTFDTDIAIGLSDAENEGVWKWVNGESFSFSNWDSGEPNNYNNNEDYVIMTTGNDKWNDYDLSSNSCRYLCEWDSYESMNVTHLECFYFNGHYYKIYKNLCNTWEEAKEYCENKGGYLATITSKEENDAIFNYIKKYSFQAAYIGLSCNSDREWSWVTGEEFSYTNWGNGEPNNENGKEQYAEFYAKYSDGKWNDGNYCHGTGNDARNFICEWGDYEEKHSLNFYDSVFSGYVGETNGVLVIFDSADRDITEVEYESSNTDIVDIDVISLGEGNYITQENEQIATVYLKLKAEGIATITATAPDGTTASCTVTVTDKSSGFIKDFDKDMYAADQLTNNPDDYNLNYYLNEFKDPSRIIVDALRANKSFKSSVTKWKVTTEFLDANIDFVVDDELDAISYYEAIIFSVCQQTLEDTKFVDTYISSEEVKKLKLLNSINSWIKNYEATDIKFDTTLSDTRKEALAKSLNQEYGYNDISKAVVNVLDYSKDINEFYNTISKYEAISDTTGKLVPMLKSIRRTSTNSALNTALDRVIKSIESQYGKMMTAIEVGTYKIYQWEVDEVTDMILDELIMSNPYVRAIKIGGAIGKSISNFAFSTDKNIEQFFAMAYLGYFQDCLKVAVSESQLNYKLDRCSENAQQLLFSLNSLFAAYNLGCEYAKEYGEIIYEKPLIYNTFIGKKFYGNSDTYSKYKENVSSIQTSLSLELNTINKYWAYKLLDDCPSLFDKIAQKIQLYRIGSIENASIRLSGLNFKYTGNHIEPKVNIFANNEVLEQGKDFSVEYKNNKEIGIASVIITSHNVRYPGTVTKHFMISDDNFVTEYNIRDNGRPESTRLFSQSNTKTKYFTGASDKIYGLSVNVYDGENLVAEIVDGEIVSNDIPIIINGNELTILMTDRNYSVVYFTSDSRDIDVTLSKIGEEKEITDSTYYNDIIIQRNDECIHNISYDNDNIVSEMKIGDYEIECSDRPKENRDSPVTDPTEPATTESNEETTVTEPTESQTTETSESETTEPLTNPITDPIESDSTEPTSETEKPSDSTEPVDQPSETTESTTDKPAEPKPTEPVTEPAEKTPIISSASAKLKAGATKTLKVTGGTVKSWTSSKKSIAKVTKNGKVTALKKGTATITATLTTGKKLTCKVKVTTSPTIKIGKKKFSAKTTYTIKKNKSLTVTITGKAPGVKNSYKTSNKKIAKITSKRTAKKVTIKAYKNKGKATVTLKVNSVAFKIKFKVK